MSAAQVQALRLQRQHRHQTREQVGSSFKPYVLSTAVSQGMDVQNSILNSSQFLCVPR